MSDIYVTVNEQDLIITNAPTIASQGVNEDRIVFTFDSSWTGFGKVAYFYQDADDPVIYQVAIDGNNRAVIPHEVTAQEGTICFGVAGVKDDIVYTSEILRYKVVKGLYTVGEGSEPPTPGIYEQILTLAGQMSEEYQSVVAEQSVTIQNLRTDMDDLESQLSGQMAEFIAAHNADLLQTILFDGSQTSQSMNVGDTIPLSADPTQFDILEIYVSGEMFTIIPEPSLNQAWVVAGLNIPNTGSDSTNVTNFELFGRIHADELTVTSAVAVNDTGTASTRYDLTSDAVLPGDKTWLPRTCEKVIGRKIATNAELTDIRVGADGTVYQTAGDAVRSQIAKLPFIVVQSAASMTDTTKIYRYDGALWFYDGTEWTKVGTGSGSGAIVVTQAADMEDTGSIYIYEGQETGYTAGHFYYYNGSAWTDGGAYYVGIDGRDGQNGQDGADGYSPVATVTQTETGATITVTDKNGTTTASVSNGTATDAQVAAWLDEHPEATTTVEDGSISTAKLADSAVTPNKTSFIAEPYYYNVQQAPYGSDANALVPIDLDVNTYVCVAVPSTGSVAVKNRYLYLYKDGTYVGYKAGSVNTGPDYLDGFTIKYYNLTDYTSETVNQFQVRPTTSATGGIVYYTFQTPAAYTPEEFFRTVFAFRTGYKDKFSEALEIGTPGSVLESTIADGAVTNDKIADATIQPRKLSNVTNLIDYAEIVTGKHVGNPGILSGSGDAMFWIPVIPGHKYTVNYVPTSFYFYGFWREDKTTKPSSNAAKSNFAVSKQDTSYEITVPADNTIAYMAISTTVIKELYTSTIVPTWKCWESTNGETEPDDEFAFDWFKISDINRVRSSKFRGKVILGTGDSITENNSRNNNKSWLMYLPEKLGVTVYNDGKSGTGLVKKYQTLHSILYRVENNWATDYAGVTPDIVLIMGNMNDGTGTGELSSLNDLGISGWIGGGVLAVGTPTDDINTQSVYGCAKRFLEDVITMYPSAQIGWILSTPRASTDATYWPNKPDQYGHGWFEDYITAIRYQCEQYNVPVLDLYHESGFRPTNSTNMTAYMDDGSVHPNTAGIKKYMVEPIVRWIEDKFGEVD